MLRHCSAIVLATVITLAALTASADNPKAATGFFGTVTGIVKSHPDDSTSFILTVSDAEADENSTADVEGMTGKDLVIGTRLPRDKDGKPQPQVDDVAWIKTLSPGMEVSAHLFAAKADLNVLRITKPGTITKQPTTEPAK